MSRQTLFMFLRFDHNECHGPYLTMEQRLVVDTKCQTHFRTSQGGPENTVEIQTLSIVRRAELRQFGHLDQVYYQRRRYHEPGQPPIGPSGVGRILRYPEYDKRFWPSRNKVLYTSVKNRLLVQYLGYYSYRQRARRYLTVHVLYVGQGT